MMILTFYQFTFYQCFLQHAYCKLSMLAISFNRKQDVVYASYTESLINLFWFFTINFCVSTA